MKTVRKKKLSRVNVNNVMWCHVVNVHDTTDSGKPLLSDKFAACCNCMLRNQSLIAQLTDCHPLKEQRLRFRCFTVAICVSTPCPAHDAPQFANFLFRTNFRLLIDVGTSIPLRPTLHIVGASLVKKNASETQLSVQISSAAAYKPS